MHALGKTIRRISRSISLTKSTEHNIEIECRHFGKLVVLGDEKVGKTAIVRLLCIKGASDDYISTTEIQSYSLKSTFKTEDSERLSKKQVTKRIVKGQARKQTVQKILSLDSAYAKQNLTNNDNDKPASTLEHLKRLEIELVDTPSNFHITSPIEFRALVSDAKGFLLVCDEDRDSTITHATFLLNELQGLMVEADLPHIVVIINHHSNVGVSAQLRKRFEDYDVILVMLPMNLSNPIDYLTLKLFEKLNSFDEQEKAEEQIPSGMEFTEVENRKFKTFSFTSS